MIKSKSAKARIFLFSLMSLVLLIPLFLVPGNINFAGIEDGSKALDLFPTLTFSSNTAHTTTTATLTAVAVDSGTNAGIQWIKIYQDGLLLAEKTCNSQSTCTFVKVIIENNAATHIYYAQTMDLGGHTQSSSTITIIFDGFNQNPVIDAWSPVSLDPTMNENSQLGFSINAYDPNGDALNYIWKFDGVNVSTTNSYTYNADYFSAGLHTVYIVVYDNKGGTDVQTWNLTVNNVLIPTTCTLIFNPLSPQTYGIPVNASCSCTSNIGAITETTAVLERNGADVTATENNVATTLEAGTHNYRCYVIQTPNFAAAQDLDTYFINRANPNAHLALNTLENDLTIVYGTQSNATGWIEINQGAANAILYRNGANIASGSPATEISTFAVGAYNYTYVYPQSQNYTGASITRILTVTPYASTCNININPASPVTYGTASTATCTCTNPEATAQLWRNGTNVNGENGIAVTLGAGNYNYICNVSATQNYTGANVNQNYVVLPRASSLILLLNNTNGDINVNTGNFVPVFANLTNPIVGNILVYNNGAEIYNGASPYSNVLMFATPGIYNITAVYLATQNYTGASITHFVYVNLTNNAPIVNLIAPANNTVYEAQQQIAFSFLATDDNDATFDCTLYLDTIANETITTINNTLSTFYLGGISLGNHTWQVRCIDTQGLIGFSEIWNFAIRNHNIGISDNYTNSINGVRISYTNGTDVMSNPAGLYIGSNYTVRSRINNYGAQLENINTTFYLENSTNRILIGYEEYSGLNIFHVAQVDLNNTNSYSGYYNITVNTTILGYADSNLTDNIRQRLVYFGLLDLEAPKYYGETANPTSPTTYGNGPYTFTINWTDNAMVQNVIFSFNNVNYTPICTPVIPTQSAICTYSINNLAAGSYTYQWFAVDPSVNRNSTIQRTYIVNTASPIALMHLAINGTEVNQIFTYPTLTNTTAWNTIAGQTSLIFNLYRNGNAIANPDIAQLGGGVYTYLYNTTGNQNYSAGSVTRVLTMLPATTTLILTAPNWTIYEGTIANVSCSANNTQVIINLYRNNLLVSNPDLTTLAIGNYIYVCNTTGNANYSSASVSNILQVIPKLSGEVHLYLNGNENNITLIYPTATNATATTPYGYVSLYRNGTLLANGTSPQTNIATLAAGYYQYLANSSGDSSHYNSTITYFVSINQATSTCTLNIAPNPVTYGTASTATCTCTNPEATAQLWRNGTNVNGENGIAVTLGAGNYNYICNVSATQNYTGATTSNVLIVNRANPNAHLALNTLENDLTIVYGTQSNATGWIEINQGAANAILYRNGANIASGSPATEISTFAVGAYNYTYVYPQSQNYTGASITRILNVTRQTTNLTLNAIPSWTIYDLIQSNISCSASNSEVTIQLWRNGVLITSGNNYVQDISTLAVGNYTYICNASDSQNYSGNSVTNILRVLPKEAGYILLYLNGQQNDLNIEYLGNPVNATAVSPYNNITLYRNGTLIGSGADLVQDISSLAEGYYVYYANSSGNSTHYPGNVTRYVTINQSVPQLIIDMLPSDNVTYGQQTTTTCNITNTNEINGLIELYRRLYNWTNSTIAVNNPDIQTLAGGAYNYICNVNASQNFTSAYLERTLTVNRANSSMILLLDGNNSNITRIEGNAINHTGIVTLYSLPNVVDLTINIYNPAGNQIASSTGVNPHTYFYNYTVPGIYRIDAIFLGTENYTESNATHWANITPVIHDSNITNITYTKSNSTIYLNDVISVNSYIRNDGNVNESAINITLEDNGNVVAWQIINNLFANETVHETRPINFTWIAANDGIRTISINAVPLTGETDLSDNSQSFTARVWKVCDVIDCNEFYPVTGSDNYTINTPFNASILIVNKWNNEQFYDLKLEMIGQNGLNVTSTKTIYINLAPSQATVKKWAIEGIDYGTWSLTSYAGNREYAGNKSITITT